MRETDFFAPCVTGCARRRSIVSERPNGGSVFGARIAARVARFVDWTIGGCGPLLGEDRLRAGSDTVSPCIALRPWQPSHHAVLWH